MSLLPNICLIPLSILLLKGASRKFPHANLLNKNYHIKEQNLGVVWSRRQPESQGTFIN